MTLYRCIAATVVVTCIFMGRKYIRKHSNWQTAVFCCVYVLMSLRTAIQSLDDIQIESPEMNKQKMWNFKEYV